MEAIVRCIMKINYEYHFEACHFDDNANKASYFFGKYGAKIEDAC
jgi:hypothetical protein